MKKYNNFDSHTVLLGIIIPFLVFFISINTTYAYFTASAMQRQSSSQTGTIQITFKTDDVSTVSVSTDSGTTSIVPGDTLNISGTMTNSGSADAYAIIEYVIRITKKGSTAVETVFKKYCTFNDSNALVEVNAENQATLITSKNSKSFTSPAILKHEFKGKDYDNTYKNAKVEYEINAYAIQKANLTQAMATDMLMENAGYHASKIYGNSYQAPVYGKNMLNKNSSITGYYINSSGAVASGAGYDCFVTEKIYVSPSTVYTYSGMGNVQGTTVSRTGYQYDENDNPLSPVASSYGESVAFTTSKKVSYVRLQYLNTAEQPMLELGSSATEYEAYISGPAPTPTNPSQIQSVGEKTSNIYDIYSSNICARTAHNLSNYPIKVENDILYSGGVSGKGEGSGLYFKIEENTEYTFSFYLDFDEETETNSQIVMYLFNEINDSIITKNYARYFEFKKGQNNFTFDSADNSYFTFMSYSTTKHGFKYSNIYLGTSTEYEPFGKYKIPVEVSNKNLFNKNTIQDSIGLNSGNLYATEYRFISDYIDCLNIRDVSINLAASFAWYDENKNIISSENKSSTIFRNYTKPEGARYLRLDFLKEIVSPEEVMCVVGTYTSQTMPDYVPHVEPFNIYLDEPLRKVGDVADYIDLETGEVVRRVGSCVFTGQETFETYTKDSEGASYYVSITNKKIGFSTSICSHFKNVEWAWAAPSINEVGIYSDHDSNNKLYFRTPNADVTNVDQFKNWLSQNQVTLTYILATPTTEKVSVPGINMKNHDIVSVGTTIQPSK